MTDSMGIVWNPSKVDESELRDAFTAALEAVASEQPEVHWFETAEDDPGRGATERALEAGCTLVIAAGGDGTVRAVAERLGESGEPAADLGIVPLGTGNLLARNLDVPLGDARAAFERALTGAGDARSGASAGAAPLDLGVVEIAGNDPQRIGFVVMLGFGIDAQMIEETDDELKAKAGWLAYVESLGRAASNTDAVEFSLRVDGADAREARAHTLLVGNCGSLQGRIPVLPDALPDDGVLDLLALSADGVGPWLDTVRDVVWDHGLKRLLPGGNSGGDSDDTDTDTDTDTEDAGSVLRLSAHEFQVSLAEPRLLEVDGDTIGEVTDFTVRVLPAALRVR